MITGLMTASTVSASCSPRAKLRRRATMAARTAAPAKTNPVTRAASLPSGRASKPPVVAMNTNIATSATPAAAHAAPAGIRS